ncbi:MAG: tyrosine-type recombinase/integrase [Enterobacteriaceae bacterium]
MSKHADLSLAQVRLKAEEIKEKVRQGDDPITERKRLRRPKIKTVDDLFNDWYQDLQRRLKHPSIPNRIFKKDISPYLGDLALNKVTPLDIRSIIQQITTSNRPTIANDALMYLKQIFNHAIKLNLMIYNPAAAFKVDDAGGLEKSRDRALSMEELTQVFQVLRNNNDSFTRENYLACALLIVLGVRKNELIESRWAEFSLEQAVWELSAERSKSAVAIMIPLPPQVVEWLQELRIRACGSEYVFPNRRSSSKPHMGSDTLNRAIAKLFGHEPGRTVQPPNKMGTIEYFTVHDLRRTCRSLLAAQGIPGHAAERCLNHKLKGVEGIYDRYDYFEERKEALNKIATVVQSIVI